MAAIGEFTTTLKVKNPPRAGTPVKLQVFGDNPGPGPGPGSNLREVEVIMYPDLTGWLLYRVEKGDTLTGIVRKARDFGKTTVAPDRRGKRRRSRTPTSSRPAGSCASRSAERDLRASGRRTSRRGTSAPATAPAAGKVRTQAVRIVRATPQRTAEKRLVAPTPITALVMVCVVEIGASKTYAVV